MILAQRASQNGGDAFGSACVSSDPTSQIRSLSASPSDHRGFLIRALRPIGNILFAKKHGGIPPTRGRELPIPHILPDMS